MLKGELDLPPLLRVLEAACLHGGDRCFDTEWLKALNRLGPMARSLRMPAKRDVWRYHGELPPRQW
ncbi:hypothetical protein CK221_27895 [Mesorhizobium sp. WSM3868]|nr:hypothetical protein CK221_27895 [Mesorhizobium sp. WSM3868]